MSRRRRYDAPGCRHHVMNRGARHEPIFHDDAACANFLEFVSELPKRYGLLIHAYALMPNHYHLLVESTRGHLSAAMGFLGSCYTRWSNIRHTNWDGPIFRGRFHSVEVSCEEHWYYLPIYIHLNPVRAGIVGNIAQSRWTSHGAYAGLEKVPEWMNVQVLLERYGDSQGYLDALDEVVLGRRKPPENLEQVTFAPYVHLSSSKTERLSTPEQTPTYRHVLQSVARVCGVQENTLQQIKRGRVGNMPRKLAAYWLTIGAGLKNTEAGTLLDMHPVRVSQAIRQIREKREENKELNEIMAALEHEILKR